MKRFAILAALAVCFTVVLLASVLGACALCPTCGAWDAQTPCATPTGSDCPYGDRCPSECGQCAATNTYISMVGAKALAAGLEDNFNDKSQDNVDIQDELNQVKEEDPCPLTQQQIDDCQTAINGAAGLLDTLTYGCHEGGLSSLGGLIEEFKDEIVLRAGYDAEPLAGVADWEEREVWCQCLHDAYKEWYTVNGANHQGIVGDEGDNGGLMAEFMDLYETDWYPSYCRIIDFHATANGILP